jgi:hypothetical protein
VGSDQTAGPESVDFAKRLAAENAAKAASHTHHNDDAHEEHGHSKAGTGMLALGALGVVYGDIGTSPLYSLKETFTEKSHPVLVDNINVYGVCSLCLLYTSDAADEMD